MSGDRFYEEANNTLHTVLQEMQAVAGDVVGPKGKTHFDLSLSIASGLRKLADLNEVAGTRRVSGLIFPSPTDHVDA